MNDRPLTFRCALAIATFLITRAFEELSSDERELCSTIRARNRIGDWTVSQSEIETLLAAFVLVNF